MQVDLARSGAEYIEARAVILGARPHDVVRAALKEYAQRHPIKRGKP